MIDVHLVVIHCFKGLQEVACLLDAHVRLVKALVDTVKHPSDDRQA